MSVAKISKLFVIMSMVIPTAYGSIFPDQSSFDISGSFSGWTVSGDVSKVSSPVYGGTGLAVRVNKNGWCNKFFSSTASINSVTVWLYDPSSNRTSSAGENRSVNILLQQNGLATGPYLTILTYNNLRYLACFQSTVCNYITPILENQFVEIKLELLGNVSNQKYIIYYNGNRFDNSGQGYRFNSYCSRIDQVMFSNSNVNSNAGVYSVLDQITVNGSGGPSGLLVWSFEDPLDPEDAWQKFDSAALLRSSGALEVSITTGKTFGIVTTQVNPFDSGAKSILMLDVNCPGQESLTLHWKNAEMASFMGIPIALKDGRSDPSERIDLRTQETWTGTITDVGIGFGTYGTEHLSIESIGFYDNTAGVPFVRAKQIGFKEAINRPGRAVTVSITLQHVSGPAIAASAMTFVSDSNFFASSAPLTIPAINPGEEITVETQVLPVARGESILTCYYNGQKFTKLMRIDESVARIMPGSYAVPQPVPVQTNYNIGTFYFPGWSSEANNWQLYDYLGLEPIIGKYLEGQPEVSDWQIKFAVENGVNFFIFDWYWADGTERLGAALRDGFMRAHYKDMMKFCLLLCNHTPFDGSTDTELTQITNFWINNYLKQPNYLLIQGKPCVLFWSLYDLRMGLGNGTLASASTVASTLNSMRQRCIDAGLAGLYIGVCMQNEESPSSMALFNQCGFDFVTEYAYGDTGQILDQSPYHEYALNHSKKWAGIQQAKAGLDLDDMPTMTVGYDRKAWKGPLGLERFERKSTYFAEALVELKTHLDTYGKTFCILGDWNEYGEGCFLEPTNIFGFSDLEAVRQTFANPGNWPVNIGPSDVGWPYLQPFVKKDVSIINYSFENDAIAPAFSPAYDNDPIAPLWTVQESAASDQVVVFGTETVGALPQWVHNGSNALRFKIISDPMSFRPSVYTSFQNKTAVRWSFWIYVPSNQLVQSSTRAFDFAVKGIKTSDHATEDRASLASLYYVNSGTAQIKIYSPLHGGWQNPITISTDQYHHMEFEARTLPYGNAWFVRIDGQLYDNNGDGWSLFNPVDYFTNVEIRGGELAGVQIFIDDYSTSWIPQFWFGDINKDNITDFKDLGLLAAHWLALPCNSDNQWCDNSDCDQDGKVDFLDFALLTQNWLN